MTQDALPLIIVIDIDGTMIGDISPQISSYDIFNAIKSKGGHLSQKANDVSNKLKCGILRPYFAEFVQRVSVSIPRVEFFVYTASEHKWALNIVKHIEKACHVKFNKPIFTRKECVLQRGEYMKAVKFINKSIFRTLKKKFNLSNITDINDSILIIDNRSDIYSDNDLKHHVQCSTYNYKYPENIPALFDATEYVKHYDVVAPIISRFYDFQPPQDFMAFQERFYSLYTKLILSARQGNAQYVKDVFFKRLYKLIIHLFVTKKYAKFDPAVVRFINRHLGTETSTPR